MKTKTFILHLERATERKKQVAILLNCLPGEPEVFSAVDGRAIPADKLSSRFSLHAHRPNYPFSLNVGEIATFLSYRSCWQRIINEDLDYAIIVEDDVVVTDRLFLPAFNMAIENLKSGDYVRFSPKSRETPNRIIDENNHCRLFQPKMIGLGTQFQIVTNNAAKKLLLASEVIDRPVDTFIQARWLHGVNVLTSSPSGITEISGVLGGSTIQKQAHYNFSSKLKKEILRPLYRLKVFVFSRIFVK